MNNIKKSGFTIVELLVVIVVIGILASITIVSYTGISQKAIVASLQSDLANASNQIKIFQALNSSSDFPTANNCSSPSAAEICLKASNGNYFSSYMVDNVSNPKKFSLNVTNNSLTYRITDSTGPTLSYTSLAVTDPANWVVVGNQVWGKYNLNVGSRVNGAVSQTNNGGSNIVEKYCYGDSEANCTTYGGLYQWDEAMRYVMTEGAQGICPVNSHIPTNAENNTLVNYLGGDQVAGTKLKSGGSSGLNIPLSGYRGPDGLFHSQLTYTVLWSSSYADTFAWYNSVSTSSIAFIDADDIVNGFLIRCIGN